MDALAALRARRSTSRLVPPGPTPPDLRTILEAAVAAPDHGELRPWRFVVLEGDALGAFGAVLEDAYVARCTEQGAEPAAPVREKERTKLGRAPMVVVVGAARQRSRKVPWEEQLMAVAAAAQNALVAATALGYGSMWRTGDSAVDPRVKRAVGLGPDDALVGFVYLGTVPPGAVKPPREPDLDGFVSWWRP